MEEIFAVERCKIRELCGINFHNWVICVEFLWDLFS